MFRILPVKEFAARKRFLVAQSELHRHTFLVQAAEAQHVCAHIKKRFAIVGLSSVALGAGASIAKLFFGRNSGEERSGVGWFSKIASGVGLARHLKSLFTGFKAGFGSDGESRES